ncbi:MAG: tRNA-dihydrouridine synthase family protein, partial [Planctomycetota bacterium]
MDLQPLPSADRLLSPLRLRGCTLESRIFQAPLAGYSNPPFRLQCRRLGRPGMLANEMVSARSLLQGRGRAAAFLARSPEEGPVQYQLWGTDPRCLAEGARISEDAGADAVDLNCGCPVPKVVASGSGVAL